MTDLATKLDGWAEGDAAALVLEQPLRPVIGTLVYPPTFASERGSDEPSGYVIDRIDGRGVVTLDNPGAEANRIEPVFMPPKPLAELIPQITIKVGNQQKNLLELAHRAADALACSVPAQRERIRAAFEQVLVGDHSSLAEFAPTSLVFGAWDSRGTGAKLPRLLEARIDAYGVELRQRNGQYFTAIDFGEEGLLENEPPKSKDDPRSKAGFRSTPTKLRPGGVELVHNSRIVRTVTIHLAGIQRLGAGADEERGQHLRQYVLGLALAAATAPMDLFLRQGCSLVPPKRKDGEPASIWKAVNFDGSEEDVDLQQRHDEIVKYARAARDRFFGPEGSPNGSFKFEEWIATPEGAKAELDRRLGDSKNKKKDEKPNKGEDEAAAAAP